MDALVAALAEAVQIQTMKVSQATEGAGTWSSTWTQGGFPSAGTVGTLGGALNSQQVLQSNAGAVKNFANAAVGNANFLAGADVSAASNGVLIIADRLWAVGGISGTSIVSQPVTNVGLIPPRDAFGTTVGVCVEPWIEIYTPPGATAATWTVTGTDEAGNTGRTWTYAHPANAETANQMAPMVPGTAAGGIRQMDSFIGSISTGTAGSIGVTMIRRLAQLSVPANNFATVLDFAATKLPLLFDNTALMLIWLNSSGTQPILHCGLKVAEMTP